MPTKYKLPCDCGIELPVEVSQAGQVVTCSCGQKLEVPSMRAIRELEPIPDTVAGSRAESADWNLSAGLMFAIGVLIAVLAGSIAGGAQFKFWQFNQYQPLQQNLEIFVNQLETATPSQLLDEWNASREFGLGEHFSSPFVRAQANARFFAGARNIALTVMLLGIVMAISSAFLRGGRRSPR